MRVDRVTGTDEVVEVTSDATDSTVVAVDCGTEVGIDMAGTETDMAVVVVVMSSIGGEVSVAVAMVSVAGTSSVGTRAGTKVNAVEVILHQAGMVSTSTVTVTVEAAHSVTTTTSTLSLWSSETGAGDTSHQKNRGENLTWIGNGTDNGGNEAREADDERSPEGMHREKV